MAYNKWVTDVFTGRDIGQMMLSVFAIIGVFSSNTVNPVSGLALTIFTIVLLYTATLLFITKRSYLKAAASTLMHLKYGIIVSFVLTFIVGIIFGHELWRFDDFYNLWFNTDVAVAFNAGLFWATILDSLKD